MIVRIGSRRRRGRSGPLWHFSRFLFLLIGLGALGYTGWIYLDQYRHQHRTSQAFDSARAGRGAGTDARTEGRTPSAPSSPSKETPPDSAQTFPARLTIARLGLTTMIEEGVGEPTLRRAAGHIPSTALPGNSGNVGVAGHRDTLFRPLRGIRKHDRIVISTLSNDYDYEVTSTAIVNPSNVAVLAPTPGENTLTLVTCYPFYYVGSAPNRFIVKARQVSPVVAVQKPAVQEPAVQKPADTQPEMARPAAPIAAIAAHRVDRTKRTPKGVDNNSGPLKVRFEVLKSHSRELAPGISMGLTGTDVAGLRVDGWMWVMPDRRTIRLRQQRALEPVVFYRDGGKRELVITRVSTNSVSGYLIVPALHATAGRSALRTSRRY
jgi:sortase A